MAGRKPQPTHLKLVKGNTRKDRTNQSEPKPPTGMPTRPAYLASNPSRAAWARFSKILADMGVLTIADGDALGRMCEVYAQVQALQRDVNDLGHTYEAERRVDKETGQPIDGTGTIKARPEVAMLSDADRRLRAYLTDFGLTPASRSKVSAVPGDQAGKAKDEFFG